MFFIFVTYFEIISLGEFMPKRFFRLPTCYVFGRYNSFSHILIQGFLRSLSN